MLPLENRLEPKSKIPVCWIIGKGGLLGNNLLKQVLLYQYEIFNGSDSFTWANEELLKKQFQLSVAQFFKVANGRKWIIYWAAGSGRMNSTETSMDVEIKILSYFVNYLQCESDRILKNGVFVFSSSEGAIYGGSKDYPISERSSTACVNAYGRGKLKQESIITSLARDGKGATVLIYRLSTLYGVKQENHVEHGLLSTLSRSIYRKQLIHIYVPLDTMRDFISADDAAKIIIKDVACVELSSIIQIKIIASETSTSIARILTIFKAISNCKPLIVTSANFWGHAYQNNLVYKSDYPSLKREVKTKSLEIGIAEILSAESLRANL